MRAVDFAAVFDASPNAYMLLDRELRYVAANPAYLRVTRSRLEDLLGQRILDLFPHDPDNPNNENAARLLASLERVRDTGQPDVLPLLLYRIPHREQNETRYEDHYWSATHTPIFDAQGQVQLVLQHTVDVTALQKRRPTLRPRGAGADDELSSVPIEADILSRAELVQERNALLGASLAERERLYGEAQAARAEADWAKERLQAVFTQAPVAVAVFRGPAALIELANSRMCDIWGRAPAELLGRPLVEAVPELEGQGLMEPMRAVLETGTPFVGTELPVRLARAAAGGLELAYFNFVYQPLRMPDGAVDGVVAVAVEVTAEIVARKRAEAVQAELEAIFASFPEALYVGDLAGIRRANQPALAMLGYEDVAALNRGLPTLLSELEVQRVDNGQPLKRSEMSLVQAARGRNVHLELKFRHRITREPRVMRTSAAPIRIGDQITGAVVTQVDITDMQRALDELRNSENRLTQLAKVLGEARDFIGIADLHGNRIFVNQAGLQLVGLTDASASAGAQMLEYFVAEDRERVTREVIPAALAAGYWEGELRFRNFTTGEELPVLYAIFPLRDAAGRISALATITRDLRAGKAAEIERLRLLENEQAARAQAEQANRLKDEFLAMVSHELRTPLTAILGWIDMIKVPGVAPATRARALETIERNARSQAQLIEDLLDVSRIMSGKLALDPQPIDILGVVSAAVETVRPAAQARSIHLDVSVVSSGVVLGDPERLQQVVWNLLSNAVKFTPEAGRVTLTLDCRDGFVVIDVTDTGVGISREFLPHVFERFRQAEGGTARRLGGLGLGLSIVHYLVEAHGGTVHAFSEGAHCGSRFCVRLPLAPGRREAVRSARGRRQARAPGSGLDGLHVLVVEDEDDTRRYVCTLLERYRARVSEARSVAEALSAFGQNRPDVLLSDIGMPGEDGYVLIQKVRAFSEADGGRVPAVALTAYARAQDRARALLAGYHNHVTKPIDPDELVAVIAALDPRAPG